jgi:regulator of protease activity HflC (stomatin/prohibitin superfamily)
MKKLLSLFGLIFLNGCGFWPPYHVWEERMEGEAEFQKAESSRKIKTLEAIAAEESSKHLAQAEIERAKGVAQANKIIGDSLRGNEAYLHYLWIHNMAETKDQVIYVPTEANLPILAKPKELKQ